MKRPEGRVGMTGGIAIAVTISAFATAVFPPAGLLFVIPAAGYLINRSAQKRHKAKLARLHAAQISRFYDRCDQQMVSEQWHNPGWRA